MNELDAVTLEGMSFHACIGVLPHERELPQPIEVDLTAWVTPGAVVDYRTLYAHVQAVVAGPHLDYLEDLAQAVASRALDHPGVQRVQVAVRKPHAAVGGPLRFAAVAITRGRNG